MLMSSLSLLIILFASQLYLAISSTCVLECHVIEAIHMPNQVITNLIHTPELKENKNLKESVRP